MASPSTFYSDLRRRIRGSTNKKMLRVYDRWAKQGLKGYNSPGVPAGIRKQARAEYGKTRKEILVMAKQLR